MPVKQALGKQKQESQKCKDILSYVVKLRSAWAIRSVLSPLTSDLHFPDEETGMRGSNLPIYGHPLR